MIPVLVIGAFLAIQIREIAGPSPLVGLLPTWALLALTLAPIGVMATAQWVCASLCARAMDRRGSLAAYRLSESSAFFLKLAVLIWHAIAIGILGWADAVRAITGNLIGIDECIIALPPVAAILWTAFTAYPMERRIRQAAIVRALDRAEPIHPMPSRIPWAWAQWRHQAALLFIPLTFIQAWAEFITIQSTQAVRGRGLLAALPAGWRTEDALAIAGPAIQLVGALAIMSLAPLVVKFVWDTVRVPTGPMRQELTDLCTRAGVPVAGLLLWRTGGTMVNGAVVGIAPWLRYVVLTDGLLERLPEDQARAVIAHEVGHVRMRHMLWLAIGILATVGTAGVPAAWLSILILARTESVLAAELTGGGLTLAATLFMVGFLSRRYEWQADAFAVRSLSGERRKGEGSGPVEIDTNAVLAMSGALARVASLNGMDPRRRMWRHGSIDLRRRKIRRLIGQQSNKLRPDRTARRLKNASIAGFVAAALLLWADKTVARHIWESAAPQTQPTDADPKPDTE